MNSNLYAFTDNLHLNRALLKLFLVVRLIEYYTTKHVKCFIDDTCQYSYFCKTFLKFIFDSNLRIFDFKPRKSIPVKK